MFKALLLDNSTGKLQVSIAALDDAALPDEEVTVRVAYSTINYKDALAITGSGPIVRQFPMVPGIDLAGEVESSRHPAFKPGDKVLLNGHGVGERHWGGLAQRARVSAAWLQKLPDGLTARDAMAIGTAGYTAMLCVLALERHGVAPGSGEVLVTGANGGVGSFAIGILSALGHTVVASTGRTESAERLKALGAASVVHRSSLGEAGKPLQKERWAAVVDSVGSHTLANACAQTRYGGAVAACGMAQGLDFPASVAPFILRGVALLGVDSVQAPRALREQTWSRLARVGPALVEGIAREIGLAEVPAAADRLLKGGIAGRLVVDVNKV
ncbi:MDR family oxidoreductase [Pseudorhodoferax soli]|uniref:Acrylyl-CoA reductase (NADPH) n=1 Tax=Pseudorhodoferax soli TaxID=545864 RepID=A0A368XQ47_9BURK|nr:MDR family oxidoreductase [Pseudorhodoferax soli]RCW68637.1 acrylyl-CoA reductase (NADPH) [Pseudorhodoferax soli]